MSRPATTTLPIAWMFVLLCAAGCQDGADLSQITTTIEIVPYTEGMDYRDIQDEPPSIDLGEVGIATSRSAFFEIRNTSINAFRIESIDYVPQSTTGGTWGEITWRRTIDDPNAKLTPITVPGQSSRLIEVPYAPQQEESAAAQLIVRSSASNAGEVELHVMAQGAYLGRPEIEISYNGHIGPLETDCMDGVCRMSAPLDFGNIGLGKQATARITLRNVADCPAFNVANSCDHCALNIAPNPEGANLGLQFKSGTNEYERFSFPQQSDLPLTIRQADVDCQSSGERKVLITFDAPEHESEFETTLVVESNDPDKPLIEIPVRAKAKDAPIAVSEIRECGNIDANGNVVDTNCSRGDELAPLGRVYLDGTQSFDPSGGEIITYRWEIIEHPMGEEFNEFAWEGQNSAVSSFWIPLVGDYTVLLTVQNDNGVSSGVSEEAKVTFRASPESFLHVQLTWNNAANDQDLHLTHPSAGGHFCSFQGDCFYTNKEPQWFDSDDAGKGPNPRLDIDDTNGLGPENINIDRPQEGTYRVFVHYYPKPGIPAEPTVNTIRIYVNGLLRFSEERELTEYEQVWAAAEINWSQDGSESGQAIITPFPNPNGNNEIGSIATRDILECGSPTGWIFPGE